MTIRLALAQQAGPQPHIYYENSLSNKKKLWLGALKILGIISGVDTGFGFLPGKAALLHRGCHCEE